MSKKSVLAKIERDFAAAGFIRHQLPSGKIRYDHPNLTRPAFLPSAFASDTVMRHSSETVRRRARTLKPVTPPS